MQGAFRDQAQRSVLPPYHHLIYPSLSHLGTDTRHLDEICLRDPSTRHVQPSRWLWKTTISIFSVAFPDLESSPETTRCQPGPCHVLLDAEGVRTTIGHLPTGPTCITSLSEGGLPTGPASLEILDRGHDIDGYRVEPNSPILVYDGNRWPVTCK